MTLTVIPKINFSIIFFTVTTCLLSSITNTNAMKRRGYAKEETPGLIVVDKIEELSKMQEATGEHRRFFTSHNNTVFYIKIENDDIICLEYFKNLIDFISKSPQITHLDASKTCITDIQLSAILALCCNTLIELKLDSCFNIQTPVIECPNLIKFSLSRCFQIKDRHLAVILKQCKNTLQELDLSHCIGLVNPIIDCPALNKLNLTHCTNLVKPTIICPDLKI